MIDITGEESGVDEYLYGRIFLEIEKQEM